MSTKLLLIAAAAFALLAVANASDVWVSAWNSVTHPDCTGSPVHVDYVKVTLCRCTCGRFVHSMGNACFMFNDGSTAGSPYNFTSYPNDAPNPSLAHLTLGGYCDVNMTGSNANVQTDTCSEAKNGYSIKILSAEPASATPPGGDASNTQDCSSSNIYCSGSCTGTISCGGTTTHTNSASHATIGTIAVLVGLVANLIA